MQPNLTFPNLLVSQGAFASIPYRCVQFNLRDGSQFSVLLTNLMEMAVQRLAALGLPEEVVFREQLLPAVLEQPELALEMAQELPWSDLKAHALGPVWRTPAIFVTEAYRPGAILTLQSEVPVDIEN